MEIIILFVGIMFAAIGGLMAYDYTQFKKTAHEAKGRVVGFKTSEGSSGSTHYAPVIGYAWEGQEYQFTGRVSSNRVTLSIGNEVDILVSRTDPENARLKGGIGAIFGWLFLAIGVACIVGFFFAFEVNAFSLGIAALITCLMIFKFLSTLKRHQIYSFADLKKVVGEIKNGNLETALAGRHQTKGKEDEPVIEKTEKIITDSNELTKEQQKGKMPVWVGALFFIAGLGMLAGGGFMTHSRSVFLDEAKLTEGRVVSFEQSTSTSDGRTTTVYYPKVEYTPPGGGTVVFRHNQGSSHPSLKRGDRVKVLYSPANHNDAIIDEGWMNWFGPIIMFVMGLVFSVAGFLTLRKGLKREQQPAREEVQLDI